jgi:hypothetical protein
MADRISRASSCTEGRKGCKDKEGDAGVVKGQQRVGGGVGEGLLADHVREGRPRGSKSNRSSARTQSGPFPSSMRVEIVLWIAFEKMESDHPVGAEPGATRAET